MLLAFLLVIICLSVPPTNPASSLDLSEAAPNGNERNIKPTGSTLDNVGHPVGEDNSNTNGKEKTEDTDKSMRTHAEEIAAWIETLPKEQRYGALRIHGEWVKRTKAREKALAGGALRAHGKWVERAKAREIALEDQLARAVGYAKDKYCARHLRSAIDGVRVRNVCAYIEDEKRQNALSSALGIVWKNREKILCSVLVILGSVMKSVQNNTKDEICIEKAKQDFKTAVERLRKLDLILPVDKPGFVIVELIKEIAFLNNNENQDESRIWELWKEEHKDFWLRKSTVWKSETDLNSCSDALLVQILVKNIINVEHFPTETATLHELAYLKAIVRAHVEGIQLSNLAEQCLWMITVHRESFFSQVVIEVSNNSNEWKKLDETEKHLRFCAAYGRFYDALFIFDPYRYAPYFPSFCRVRLEDYEKFVKQITRASPDLRVVGNALIKLTVSDDSSDSGMKN